MEPQHYVLLAMFVLLALFVKKGQKKPTAQVAATQTQTAAATAAAAHGGHGGSSTAPATPAAAPASSGIFVTILKVVGLSIILMMTLGVGSCVYGVYTWSTTPTPPPPRPIVVVQGQTNKLYRFEDYPGGCVLIPIRGYSKWYPQGGKIRIDIPDGKSVCDAEGGPTIHLGETPVGNYRFCGKGSAEDAKCPGLDAWGVEVWN